MIDFISGFFSWGKEEIKEPIDPRVEKEKSKQFDPLTIKKEEEE